MNWRRGVGAGLALVAAGAVVAAGAQHVELAPSTAHPQLVPIASSSLACTGVAGARADATSVFAVSPNAAVAGGSARLSVARPADGAGVLGTTSRGGVPLNVDLSSQVSASGVDVRAEGALAPGVAAAQFSSYRSRGASGTTAGRCEPPRTQWWFDAVDTGVGTTTMLVLTNPEPAQAVLDLQFLGSHGPIPAAGSSGIAVRPESRLVLDLARYAPGHDALTVHVSVTQGAVAAAVSTTRLDGITPAGAEEVPAAAPPAPSVVVNAGIAGVRRQSLVVTNPTDSQQLVAVRILAADGAFTSTALPHLQVPPQSVVVHDLTRAVGRQPAAVQLTASGLISGAIVSEQSDAPRDFAVASVTTTLRAAAVVPIVPTSTLTVSLVTARPAPSVVRVSGVDARGRPTGHVRVRVSGARTATWQPPHGWHAAYVVVQAPSRGEVHAEADYASPSGVTQLPVVSSPRLVVRPAVEPAAAAQAWSVERSTRR